MPCAGPEISCLCANREGGVWFGTEEDGLHFVQERLIWVFTKQDGLSGNDVRTVCSTPDGGLWVATAEGLNHYRNGEWTRQSEGKARSVASDQQGRLWFGDQGGGQNKLLRDRYNRAKNGMSSFSVWNGRTPTLSAFHGMESFGLSANGD